MTPADKIVEAVAREICHDYDADPDWGNPPFWRTPWVWERAQRYARATLKAIDEPSRQMVDDGEASPVRDARNIPVSIKCWQAMLSALTKQLTDEGK